MPKVVNEKSETLYHVQSVSDWTEDPVDIFIFANEEPDRSKIRQLIANELGLDLSDSGYRKQIDALSSGANTYTVYAS